MKKLVIFGASQFAEIAHYYFTQDSQYEVVAFTVNASYLKETRFAELPIVPFERLKQEFPPQEHEMFVAVGIQQVNQQRKEKVEQVGAMGYRLASFVSSNAWVPPGLRVGPNSMIMEGVGIQPFTRIGRNSIIWSGTRIGFHSCIGDHCWLACCTFGESVVLGDYTFVGINATIAPSVSIGKSNVIGAGAVILHDTGDFQVYRALDATALDIRSDWLRQI